MDFFQVTAFAVIPMTLNRGILSGCLLFGGFIFFFVISKIGEKFLEKFEAKEEELKEDKSLTIISA